MALILEPREVGTVVHASRRGAWRRTMPDGPVDGSTRRTGTENTVLIGVVLAAGLAILLVLGATMFNSNEKSVDPNRADAPAASQNSPR